MSLATRFWSSHARRQFSITRLLAHLPESENADTLIQFAVELACHCDARLRGLTVVDTSRFDDFATTCESAAYAAFEQQRLAEGEAGRDKVRAAFSQACLNAGLDFDLHRKRGRRFEVLRDEAKCHDLSVASVRLRENQRDKDLRSADVLQAILGGLSPLLVLREKGEFPQRILLVQDNSAASNRAIRSFLSQGLFPEANIRLLAVGADDNSAKQALRESIDSLGSRLTGCETGYVVGRPAQVVPEFALRWEADLVVVGAQRKWPIVDSLLGQTASQVLNRTPAALYASS